ncbi:MAG TPA: vWA domain-containing protein [Nitrososphaera sp.]|nr:vWA domain-containing protein [Nitrososphaera sp.]
MENRFFVVDGLNICKENPRGRAKLSILLTLLLELKKKGHDFLCIFDESAFREFKRQGDDTLRFYNNLIRSYENHFSKIRGEADEKIVVIADKQNADVISNDSFSEYRQKYPWLRDRNRVAKVSVVRGMIFSEGVDIETTENEDIEAVWDELKSYLDGKPKVKKSTSKSTSKTKSVTKSKPKPEPTPEPTPAPEPEPKQTKVFSRFPSKRSAKRVVPITNQVNEDEKPKEERTAPKMSAKGSEIINQLVEEGFITPDIAQILLRGVEENVTVVKTRKNEMVAVVLVIDKSGSMDTWQQDVIDGQAVMIQGLLGASPRFDIRFAQILFNDHVDYFQKFCEFRDKTDSKRTSPEVKILDKQTYRPGGFTALYDAILKGVCALTPIIYAAQEQGVALETKVCILTDGIDEGPYGPGSGSKIPPSELEQAIKYMLNEGLISNIILAGIGSHNYKDVGKSIGIDTVIEIPERVSGEQLDETKRQIRRAFELFSKTGRTR